MVSEKSPDRTQEENEVQAKSKEDKEMEFNSEENRSDGNEHEHLMQASNQKGQLKYPSLLFYNFDFSNSIPYRINLIA